MIKIINVTLRQRKYKTGRISLYLDFYPPITKLETGKQTRREYLSLFLLENPRSAEEKQKNKSTLEYAKRLRDKRIEEFRKPEVYNHIEKQLLLKKTQANKNVVKYLKEYEKRAKSKSDKATWSSAIYFFSKFKFKDECKNYIKGVDLKFCDVTVGLLKGFKEYLLEVPSIKQKNKKLHQNTASAYFNKIRFGLKEAFTEDILESDIGSKVKGIKVLESRRKHLTEHEIELLLNTPCKCNVFRRAAFFSILTGLRNCDIRSMRWGQIEYVKGSGYCYNLDQQKTKSIEYLPISEQAYKLLGNPKGAEDKVFKLKSKTVINQYLNDWLAASGIEKHITFHCFRHTNAILHVINRTDLLTLSSMLGHKSVKTTQIYAKAVNNMKIEAANSLKINKIIENQSFI